MIELTYAVEAAGSRRPGGGGGAPQGVCVLLCAACLMLLIGCWMLVVGSSVLYLYLRYVPYSIETGAFVSFVGSF